MAKTNYERSQGETWRITISLEDENCVPTQLASEAYTPSVYFTGLSTKTGKTSIPIRFQYYPPETKTWGRGSTKTTATGVFRIYAYIPADEVGSCSLGHNDRASCVAATGTWTVDTAKSLLTTSQMEAGVWKYAIRMSDSPNPSNLESVKNILEGDLTVVESVVDITDGAEVVFSIPASPPTV